MLNFNEINVLGNILDTTYGKSSTTVSPTMSIKCSLAGDMLTVRYTTIVNFGSESSMSGQSKRYADESAKITNDYMKETRKQFKESAGRALKIKEMRSDDSVEVIAMSSFSPRKTAYYRKVTVFKVD